MKNPTEPAARPDSARPRWVWLVPAVTYLTVLVITAITGAVSYEHEYQLAHRNGQAPWVSSLLPFTVDGMILAASVVLLWAAGHGIRRPLRPMAVLVVGIGATIGANLAAGIGHGWLGAAVSAWCGLALIMASDVAMWLAGTRRDLASGNRPATGAACSCPPPPVTLAEALPLARAYLRDHGLKHGEQELADRFAVTRAAVRRAQSAPVAAVIPQTPAAADPAPLHPPGDGQPPRPVRPPAGTAMPSPVDTVPAGPSLASATRNGASDG